MTEEKKKYVLSYAEGYKHLPAIQEGRIVGMDKASAMDVQELRDYCWKTHRLDIGNFSHIVQIEFRGTRFAYDYPSVVLNLEGADV